MVRVSNIILPPEGDFLLLKKKAARILGVPMGKIHRCVPVRQSIDARKKSDVHYVMTVDVALSGEADVVARVKSSQVRLHFSRCHPNLPEASCGGGQRSGRAAGRTLLGAGRPTADCLRARTSVGTACEGCGGILEGRGFESRLQCSVWRGGRRDFFRWKIDHGDPRSPPVLCHAHLRRGRGTGGYSLAA